MRFLSMIRVEEKEGQAPSERLMKDMGTLIEEMTRDGSLVHTAGLRPTKEGKRMRWNRGALSAVDGPFTETKEVIAGFAILEARSITDALALTKRFLEIHGEEWNLECEVRQVEGPEFGCEAAATVRFQEVPAMFDDDHRIGRLMGVMTRLVTPGLWVTRTHSGRARLADIDPVLVAERWSTGTPARWYR